MALWLFDGMSAAELLREGRRDEQNVLKTDTSAVSAILRPTEKAVLPKQGRVWHDTEIPNYQLPLR